jgi:hypothetical protein
MKNLIFSILFLSAAAQAYNPLNVPVGECFDAERMHLILAAKIGNHQYQAHTGADFEPILVKTKTVEFSGRDFIVDGIRIKYTGMTNLVMSNGFRDNVNTFKECAKGE